MIESRPYQIEMTNGARTFYRDGGKALLIQAATGSGKSHMGASSCAAAVERGHSVFWITHRRELLKQVSNVLREYRVDHSFIAAGFPFDPTSPLHVCSLETLRRRLGRVRAPKFIVWDEARHIGAATWRAVFERYKDAWHLGLDATPQRADESGLGQFFQKMLCGPSMQWLIENKFLAPYRIFAPSAPDLSGLHVRRGDYVVSEMESIFDKPTIVGDAVNHYRKFAAGKRALVFCVSIAASKHQAEAFRQAGFAAAHLDGDASTAVRDLALQEFRDGKLQIICSVGLFTEGLDIVGVEVIVQLRPTQSRALYLQMIGRGLRPSLGKTECLIIDACANCHKHGLPTDPYEWTLDYTKSTKKAKPSLTIRVCPKCWAASSGRAYECKNCGFLFPIDARKVDEREGELQEITPEMLAKRAERQKQGRARSLEELKAFARSKGYSEFWALHVWNARQAKRA